MTAAEPRGPSLPPQRDPQDTESRAGLAPWGDVAWQVQPFPSALRVPTTARTAGELRAAAFKALSAGGFQLIFPSDRPDPSQPFTVNPVIEGTIVGERIDSATPTQRLKKWLTTPDALGSEFFLVIAAVLLGYALVNGNLVVEGVGVSIFVVVLLVVWFNYYNRPLSTILVRLTYDPNLFSAVPAVAGTSKPGEVSLSFGRLQSRNEGIAGFQFQRTIVSVDLISAEAAGVPQIVASLSAR